MTDQPQTLAAHLSGLRADAGMTVEQVCHATKIQAKYLQALEQGRYGDLPSNTHLRAFALAAAKACGGDELTTAAWWSPCSTPAPRSPRAAVSTARPPPPAQPAPSSTPAAARALPRLAAAGPALEAPASGLAAASARLRGLPLLTLLALLALAGLLSYGAAWGIDHGACTATTRALAAAAAWPRPARGRRRGAEPRHGPGGRVRRRGPGLSRAA